MTKALRKAGIPATEIDQFCDEALASSENELLEILRSMGHIGALTCRTNPSGRRDHRFALLAAAASLRSLNDSRFGPGADDMGPGGLLLVSVRVGDPTAGEYCFPARLRLGNALDAAHRAVRRPWRQTTAAVD
jgi:hypothetical protein